MNRKTYLIANILVMEKVVPENNGNIGKSAKNEKIIFQKSSNDYLYIFISSTICNFDSKDPFFVAKKFTQVHIGSFLSFMNI